jgi:hypothetical protein
MSATVMRTVGPRVVLVDDAICDADGRRERETRSPA